MLNLELDPKRRRSEGWFDPQIFGSSSVLAVQG